MNRLRIVSTMSKDVNVNLFSIKTFYFKYNPWPKFTYINMTFQYCFYSVLERS